MKPNKYRYFTDWDSMIEFMRRENLADQPYIIKTVSNGWELTLVSQEG